MAYTFDVKFLSDVAYSEQGFAESFREIFSKKVDYDYNNGTLTMGNFSEVIGGYFIIATGEEVFNVSADTYVIVSIKRDVLVGATDISVFLSSTIPSDTVDTFHTPLLHIAYAGIYTTLTEYLNGVQVPSTRYDSLEQMGLGSSASPKTIHNKLKIGETVSFVVKGSETWGTNYLWRGYGFFTENYSYEVTFRRGVRNQSLVTIIKYDISGNKIIEGYVDVSSSKDEILYGVTLENTPKIRYGTSVPSNSIGNNGDIYIKY